MSDPTTPNGSAPAIPESLRRQLEDFRRHLWRVKIFEAVIAGVIGLLVSFLLVYGLDRVWQTPGMVRLGILLAGTSLFAVFAPFWLHRWVWRHRRETQLARLIARRYPGLGDRLLGVIELQDQKEGADSLSPRLRAAAMEAVAVETSRRKLDGALPPPRHRRWALAALVLAAAAAAAFTVTPRASLNALQRWLMPLSDTERYTFTRLDRPPTRLAVPFGEAFDVRIRLSKDSEQQPATGAGRYGLQPAVEAALNDGGYLFQFPGQQDPGTVVFRIGDVMHELRVEPVERPSAEEVLATVVAPSYLGIPERTAVLNTGVLSAVQGSKVRITLKTNRPLASATFGPTRALLGEITADETAPVAPEVVFAPIEGALSLDGATATTPEIEVGETAFEIPFGWTDQLGLVGDSGFRLRIDALTDAPPAAYLQGIERQLVMLPEETVDFEVLAEDDFGVRSAGIEWAGEFTKPTDQTPAKGELKLAAGGPEERRASEAAAFSPSAFGIGPQKILLRAYAEDYFPDRPRSYSEPVVIFVLTRDEHAQLLKSQFDRAITELEDLARRELNQFEENQRLERLEGEELQQEEGLKRLEASEQAEAENLRRMEELTERMEEMMKDAARNGEIDKETLRKMAESLKSMQELAKEDMPKVEEKLAEAGEQSNTPEKSKEDTEQAVEEQQKVLEKMQEAIEKANDANERFEAGTFVNRLKKAASEESGIVSSLVPAHPRIVGLRQGDIDPADLRLINDAARQQLVTGADVRWIQEDLAHYHARTDKEVFKQIADEMAESKVDIGMEDVRTRLLASNTFTATEGADKWAAKLNEWAKKLEDEMQDDQGGGDGGEGGSPSPEDEDFEFMLRVMKMIQQQQDLRARTRALEQLRRTFQQP